MHVHFLDPYIPRASPIHQLDGRVKFVLTLAFILTVALTPVGAWPVYVLLLSLVLSAEVVTELGVGSVLKRSALALPFVLAALPGVFIAGSDVPPDRLYSIGAVAISLAGLERFVSVAVKSWLSVQAAVVLASSTPFPELLVAMRAVGTPRLLVSLFGLMWRYLFVLADEALRLMRARAARSGQADTPGVRMGGSLAWRARVSGGMAGNLFLRAFERSDRIYMAMVSRGYDGETRSLPLSPITPTGWRVLGSGLAILVVLLGIGMLLGR
jgi:cobalt/nickel transport system permease protein